MRVTFFSESDKGACYRYRVDLPIRALNKEKRIVARFSMKWEPTIANDDVYIFHRNHLKEAIQLLHKLINDEKKVVIYDIDDNIFHIPESNPVFNLYMHEPSIPWNQAISIRFATAVSVSSKGLLETYKSLNDSIKLLPNCILIDECKDVEPILNPGKILIFWGGSPTHKEDLDLLRSVVPVVHRRHGDKVEFVIMGEPDLQFSAPVISVPFGNYKFFQRVMRSCHIGLAPMVDNPFNRGKSDLRIKELASMHLPIIASPVGEYNIADLDMIHCKEPRDWVEAISELVDSESRRCEMGEASWAWVQQWDIYDHIYKWVELLEELTNVRKRRTISETVKVQGPERVVDDSGSNRVTVVKLPDTRDGFDSR